VNRENAWLVVQVPWRTVVVGDVIVGKDGGLLVVQGFDRDADPVGLMTWSVKKGPWTLRTRDPERPVPVLKPEAEATALKLLGAELGAEAVCDGNESKGVEST
jgi:hypothetical protein